MFKLNRILLKKGIKSVFASKIFSVLIMFLMIISGTMYTMLNNSSSAFSESYNTTVEKGKLHGYVMKGGFKYSKTANDKLELYLSDLANKKYEVKDLNIANITKFQQSIPGTLQKNYKVRLSIKTALGIYSVYQNKKLENILIERTSAQTDQDIVDKLKEKIRDFRLLMKERLESNLDKKVSEEIRDKYNDELFVKSTRTIYVSEGKKSFKVIDYDRANSKNINKMVIFDGTDQFVDALNQETSEKILNEMLLKEKMSNEYIEDNYYFSNNRGYKYFKYPENVVDKSVSVIDPQSITAIVSPAYANKNNKRTISLAKIKELYEKDPHFLESNLERYSQNIIYVSGIPFFIVGIGTTPDFTYPIVDKRTPIVDADNQALVFVSSKGFQRVEDSFRTNPKENYLSIKFKKNVDEKRKKEIIEEIEEKYHNSNGKYKSVYPGYIKLITGAFDTSEQIILSANRVSVLQKLKSTINTLSYLTTTLMILFLISIIIIVFKVLIAGNRKVYATMHSLGYSKAKIAITNSIASLLIVVLPAIISYCVGYGLQFPFMGNFSKIWTIPSYNISFAWISLIVIVVVPFIFVSLTIFAITLFEMRHTIPNMLNGKTEDKASKLSLYISRMSLLGIKTKYSLSLIIKNSSKLFLVALSSFISMTALMVGFGSIGKSSQAFAETQAVSNYRFAVDLVTPTKEGGQYNYQKREDIPKLGQSFNGVEWHIPSASDVGYIKSGAKNNLPKSAIYLKNKLQNPSILKEIKEGVDAWELAKGLMPENQLNQSKESIARLNEKWQNYSGNNSLKYSNKNFTWNFINFFFEIVTQEAQDFMPFVISYNSVVVDKEDEKYTYIDSIIGNKGSPFKVIGIDGDSKMINLDTGLKKLKQSNAELPILINKFIAEKYNLDVEDEIELSVFNHIKRNYSGNKIKIKAKVVDIVDGYNSQGIYSLKTNANKVLGLHHENGFNGIFSKSKNPTILSTLPLYSENGIYPGTDSYTGNDWKSFIEKYLKTTEGKKLPAKSYDEFISIYSRNPYSSLVSKVAWKEIDETAFKNTSDLTSVIISSVEIVSIILSATFIIIVAALMFKSNKKKIATLWTLGYRKREVSKIFLSMYILPIIIAFSVAVPISIGILTAIRLFIMDFGNILIPFNLSWWMPILAGLIITSIIVLSTLITIFTQKQNVALEAFKGD